VLYGSESELDDSDEEHKTARTIKKKGQNGPRLRLDSDVPMDLLEGAATHVLGELTGSFLVISLFNSSD